MGNTITGDDKALETGEEEQAVKAVGNVAMELISQALRETTLEIGEIGDVNGIFANARCFGKLSQGNNTVQNLVLYLYRDYHRDYKTLHLLGTGFGNLEALQVLTIRSLRVYARRDEGGDDHAKREEAESLYWQALTVAIGRLRPNIELRLDGHSREGIYFANYAVAIQGLSTIRAFHSKGAIPWESAPTLMSALASLPSLENVTLSFGHEERPVAGEFRGLKNLLKSRSLRSIEFSKFNFSSGVRRALLAAFEEGSFVTNLRFTDCFRRYEVEDQTGAISALVQALQRNLSVKTLSLVGNDFNELFCEGITTVLLVNTTLEDLTLSKRSDATEEGGKWLQALFVAMQINTSLKSLNVDTFHLTDDVVCRALRQMFANNPVLESLTLHSAERLDDPSVVSWRTTLPFIRENATLKSLTISLNGDALDPHIATLCFDSVSMLERNTTLECLDIKSSGIGPDAYFAALKGLRWNTALKTLRLSPNLALMGEEEMNLVVTLVKKNYSLAVLDEGVSTHDKTGELGSLLRLNQAGRRYLIEDAASIAKGVEVLIGVSNDLGCLFYHLLENPTLCDIEHQYNTKPETGTHHQRTSN